MAINLIEDALKHKDDEIIDHLYKTMNGIVKNYGSASEKSAPELLYANLGDIVMVTQILKAMDRRNKDRLAQQQQA